MEPVPNIRIRVLDPAPIAGARDYVLLWMIAARRTTWNFALQHAAWHAERLGKPLVVFEPLGCGHRWASDRLHRFVIEGMQDNAAAFARAGVRYLPWLGAEPQAGRGVLAELAKRACVVVADDHPSFIFPALLERAAVGVGVRFEAVDGCGLLPLAETDTAFVRAQDFRRHFQRVAAPHLECMPMPDPLARLELPPLASVPAFEGVLDSRALADPRLEASLPIDHAVAPVGFRGGAQSGRSRLAEFVAARFPRYAHGRNHPDDEVASGLSAWLHFGHVGTHQLVATIFAREGWEASRLGETKIVRGAKRGWWGLSEPAEAFLDQVVIWRELGHHYCRARPDHDQWSSLPQWARSTLAAHARDPRPHVYGRADLESASTHDGLWNAAQRQLLGEGRIHNYLRMLWGKKVLEWSETPQEAWETLIELNNRWAIDGRDPNSYSGIGWVFGRFDRPWGPTRPIFGTVRYMSSENTRRKLTLDGYLRRWGEGLATRTRPRRGKRKSD